MKATRFTNLAAAVALATGLAGVPFTQANANGPPGGGDEPTNPTPCRDGAPGCGPTVVVPDVNVDVGTNVDVDTDVDVDTNVNTTVNNSFKSKRNAPSMYTTVQASGQCGSGFSVTVTTPVGGVGAGKSKPDTFCLRLEYAKQMVALGIMSKKDRDVLVLGHTIAGLTDPDVIGKAVLRVGDVVSTKCGQNVMAKSSVAAAALALDPNRKCDDSAFKGSGGVKKRHKAVAEKISADTPKECKAIIEKLQACKIDPALLPKLN